MADLILIKRNLTAGAVPTTASLALGELAVNVADGKLFMRRSGSVGDIVTTFNPFNNFIASGSVTASVDVSTNTFLITSASRNIFSINNTGGVTISGSAQTLFLVKNTINNNILTVSQSGVVIVATQSVELTGTAPNGAIYFTSGSFFVGLD
jgi:hypothetical protein